LGDVALAGLLVQGIAHPGRDRIVVADLASAAHDQPLYLRAIDDIFHRLADPDIVEGGGIGPYGKVQNEGRADRDDLDLGILLQAVDADARQIPDEIHLAAGDGRDARGRIRDRAQLDDTDLGQ